MTHVGQELALGAVGRLGNQFGLLQVLLGCGISPGPRRDDLPTAPTGQGSQARTAPFGDRSIAAAPIVALRRKGVSEPPIRIPHCCSGSRTSQPIGLGRAGQQLRRAVRPKAAVRRKKRFRAIESPADHVSAHALDDGMAGGVAHQTAPLPSRAQRYSPPGRTPRGTLGPQNRDNRRLLSSGRLRPGSPTVVERTMPRPESSRGFPCFR